MSENKNSIKIVLSVFAVGLFLVFAILFSLKTQQQKEFVDSDAQIVDEDDHLFSDQTVETVPVDDNAIISYGYMIPSFNIEAGVYLTSPGMVKIFRSATEEELVGESEALQTGSHDLVITPTTDLSFGDTLVIRLYTEGRLQPVTDVNGNMIETTLRLEQVD